MDGEPSPDPSVDEEPRSVGTLGRWLLAGGCIAVAVIVLGPGWVRDLMPGAIATPGLPALGEAAAPAESTPAGWETPPAAVAPVEPRFAALPEVTSDTPPGDDLAPSPASLSSSFECVIEPYEVVELGSPVRGVIEALPFGRSDSVSAGDVVVRLESGVERASVRLAKARVESDGVLKAREANQSLGERRMRRATKLYARKAVSEDMLDQADTEAVIARLELEQARENRLLASLELEEAREVLARRAIRSPISGVVTERLMSEGEMVDEEKIVKIAQLDPLRVEVILPASLFGSIRPGMRASLTPELGSDHALIADVEVVDRVIDPASGTFGVRLVLPNPDYAIPSGLHCQVRFLTP